MNKTRRNKNRRTAYWLKSSIAVCDKCGGKGNHWVGYTDFGFSSSKGFYTCPSLYDHTGRRKEPDHFGMPDRSITSMSRQVLGLTTALPASKQILGLVMALHKQRPDKSIS